MDSYFSSKVIHSVADALPSITTKRGGIDATYRNRTIDDLMISFMEKNNITGLSLAIVEAPYIPRVVGMGLANTTSERLISSRTMFPLGQMTQAYTAVAIMQLKEANKLELSDTLGHYLSDIPKDWNPITLYDLFTHSSGLPCYAEASGFCYTKNYTQKDIVNLVKTMPILFAPGKKMKNNRTDYYFLGMIIEKISGMSYEAYVTKNQFERAGLKHTCCISTLGTIKNEVTDDKSTFKHSAFLLDPIFANPTEIATGYDENDNPVPLSSWSSTFADSGIIASAEDISIWDICLAGEILLKDQKSRDFIYNPVQLRNSDVTVFANANWHFTGRAGYMQIEGFSPGFSSLLARFTPKNELLCVTLLANKDHVENLDILSFQIAGAYNSLLATPNTVSPSTTLQSPYSVTQTLDRFTHFVKKNGGMIFDRIDHSNAAKEANLELNPTQVLLFGNPAVGTALMQANGAVAMELPLRATAWETAEGAIWLSVTDIEEVVARYSTDEKLRALSKKMAHAIMQLINTVLGPETI